LMAVVGLQGLEYRQGELKEAIILSLSNRKKNDHTPIVFHDKSKSISQYIQCVMHEYDVKKDLVGDCIAKPAITLVSDIGSLDIRDQKTIDLNKRREILDIKLGEKVYDKNTIETVSEFDGSDEFIKYVKNKQGLVIFNMYHPGMHPNMPRCNNEIIGVLKNDISVLAIIGPEYKGVDIETWWRDKKIVFNKPNAIVVFFKNHLKVITGLSVAGLLGLIYYYKFVR